MKQNFLLTNETFSETEIIKKTIKIVYHDLYTYKWNIITLRTQASLKTLEQQPQGLKYPEAPYSCCQLPN